jgi:hypothetical protein
MDYTDTNHETEALPPPYTPPTDDLYDDDEPALPTTNIIIHAPTVIHGSNNVVSVSPIDTTRLAAIILASLNQRNQAALVTGRQTNINFNFNCGMNIVGDKNLVGNVALRNRAVLPAGASQSSTKAAASGVEDVAGTVMLGKRKASEVCL